MPTKLDDYTYELSVRDKGTLYVDGLQIALTADQLAGEQDWTGLVELMRTCSWCEEGELSQFTDEELMTAGARVLLKVRELGEELGRSPVTSPSTGVPASAP